MKSFNMQILRSYDPCYDPIKYLSEDWTGTAIDILSHKDIPHDDKLWVVLRSDIISDKIMRLFAVWCYRETLKFVNNPDSRSVECANVAERYANGDATNDELDAARHAAESAAGSAAWSAARSAAGSASWSARSARSAAESAARSAAGSASWSARSARSAAESAQIVKLIEMIEDGKLV